MIIAYRGTTADGLPVTGTLDLDVEGGIRDFEHVRQLAAAVTAQTGLSGVTLLHFASRYERA